MQECTVVHTNRGNDIIKFNGLEYHVRSSTKTLIWISIPDGRSIDEINVPHEFPTGNVIDTVGYDCDAIFARGKNVKRITFSEGIKKFEVNAFSALSIDEVVWPHSCKTIPAGCFYRSSISKISGIEDVEIIDDSAFQNTALEEIIWPSKAKSIPKDCFKGCLLLSSIKGLENIEVVEDNAFGDCPHLTNMEFGNSLTNIKSAAFVGCNNLTAVRLGNSLKEIGSHAFEDTGLKDIGPTDSICYIGEAAFQSSKLESFDWPNGCRAILSGTFADCIELREIKGCEDVIEIGDEAFYGCSSLEKFRIPDRVTHIPMGCFSGAGITEINGLEHVTDIGVAAFSGTNLSGRFRWPDKCLVIEPFVFANCVNLKEVYNLDHVFSINVKPFAGSGIESLDLSSSVCCEIHAYAFADMKTSDIKLPYFVNGENIVFDSDQTGQTDEDLPF